MSVKKRNVAFGEFEDNPISRNISLWEEGEEPNIRNENRFLLLMQLLLKRHQKRVIL